MRVARRGVFLIGGYDPQTADAFFERTGRELKRFETTWDLSAVLTRAAPPREDVTAAAEIATEGDDWTVRTRLAFLSLDSIVLADAARPLPVRLLRFGAADADYLASGTFFRMFRKAWRFALFFFYPLAFVLLCALLALVAGALVGTATRFLPIVLAMVGGLGVFHLLISVLGRRWRILQLMDLWAFSRDFLRGRRPDAEALLGRCAESIVAQAQAMQADELILAGHSVGGALILDVAARCLALDPQFTQRSGRTVVLTLGSTAPAFGLHPAAKAFRGRVQTLVDDPRLAWVDVQCLIDPINFYKGDPVADMGLVPRIKDHPAGMPFALARTVRIREMLEAATYQRIKRRMLRIHYQYVFGNTKRYFYDFFMICCGPLPLAERMRDGIVGSGPAAETPAAPPSASSARP